MGSDQVGLEAVVFDTDGVVTRTAAVHFAAWKAVFDPFLAAHGRGAAARPFTDADYRRHVDGIGRYDGVAALLGARGVALERGDPADPPGDGTICALGNRKDAAFAEAVRRHGVAPYLTTRRFVEGLRAAGVRTAVISASRNCRMVLEAAGVSDLFEVRIDGLDLDELGLPGKPDPAVFLEAVARLGVAPSRAAVVEDAVSGVRAGRAGGFATVVGLDRARRPDELSQFADVVVPDAADLELVDGRLQAAEHVRVRLADLPAAAEDTDLPRMVSDRPVAVFLDYDGTLTPIVDRPEDARLGGDAADELIALAEVCTVGIISGRDLADLADVTELVGLDGLWLAGSHGFDVLAPDGTTHQLTPAADRDKGAALRWLCAAAAVPTDALVVFIGDDVTDEDALDAVRRHGLGVVVGDEDRSSAAHDRVDDPAQVIELLGRLRAEVVRR